MTKTLSRSKPKSLTTSSINQQHDSSAHAFGLASAIRLRIASYGNGCLSVGPNFLDSTKSPSKARASLARPESSPLIQAKAATQVLITGFWWTLSSIQQSVEVMNRYSKHLKLVIPTPVPASPIATLRPAPKLPHRLDRKVNPETAAKLVADYESGVPSTDLTMIYGLGKGSVLKLLKEAGVQMRNHGLMQENFEEAATLYRNGLSLARVAQRFCCSVDSVRKEFRSHGVQIRPPNGWA